MTRLIACFFLAALALGCSVDLRTAIVGRYRGQADISAVDPQYKERAEMAAKMVNGWLLEIRQNGKATLSGLGQNGRAGTWDIVDGKLVLTPEGSDQGMTFEIRDGAKRLVPIFGEEESQFLRGASVWFKKE